MLTNVDEFTRENHLIHVDRGIRLDDVHRQLERLSISTVHSSTSEVTMEASSSMGNSKYG